jgi:hypothetical protein
MSLPMPYQIRVVPGGWKVMPPENFHLSFNSFRWSCRIIAWILLSCWNASSEKGKLKIVCSSSLSQNFRNEIFVCFAKEKGYGNWSLRGDWVQLSFQKRQLWPSWTWITIISFGDDGAHIPPRREQGLDFALGIVSDTHGWYIYMPCIIPNFYFKSELHLDCFV